MKNFILGILMLAGLNMFATAPVSDCNAAFEFTVSGMTVSFTDFSTADPGPILGWTWDFGDGTTSTEENPVHTYAEPGEYDVCLTIHGDGGCYDDKCESNIPVAAADCFANYDFEVDGMTFFFNSNTEPGPGDVDSYMWTFGDGSTADGENPSHTYAEPGVYNVCLVVHFASGCVAEYCNEVVVEGVGGDCTVTASIAAVDGMNYHFLASVTPDVEEVTYTWIFGDGTTFTETTAGTPSDPWHLFTEPGVYNVCVVIETGAGCVDEYCFEIVVEGAGGDCEADFEWDADGLTVHFIETADGAGADIISYYWEFGDGGVSDAMNPFHTYDVEGDYEVCLTIVTADGCTHTFCDEITVEETGGPCEAHYIVASTELTPDGWVVHFENNSAAGGDIVSTTWYFGDGTVAETYDAEHVYTESGMYAVCLVIATADGCTDEYCFELFVGGDGGDCEAGFEFDKELLTVSFMETADGGGSDIISYAWDFGDGTTSDDANPTHTYDSPGSYLVCLTIVTADSCISTICHDFHVEGEPGCEAKFDVVSITENDLGWVIVLDNNSTGSELYHWSFGDGGMSEAANPDHLYEAVGIYTICLTIGEEGTDCFDTKCEEVFIGGGDDCVVTAMIDSTYECSDAYEPVCGCDGITYTNSCEATYYGGVVFNSAGPCGATTIQEETIFGSVMVSPNPAQNTANISYSLKSTADVTITIMDLTGKVMLLPITHHSIPGTFRIELNTTELNSGIYIVRLSSNGNESIQKMMITK